jgi:hypothetical protein
MTGNTDPNDEAESSDNNADAQPDGGGAELVSRPDSVDFGLSRSYKLEIVSRYSRHMMDGN